MDEGFASNFSEGGIDSPSEPATAFHAAGIASKPFADRLNSAVVLQMRLGFPNHSADVSGVPKGIRASLSPPAGTQAVAELVEVLQEDIGGRFETYALDLLASGEDPQEVARTLLEPAARAIGAAWSADAQDFMRVTFALSRLQRLFWRLASRQPPRTGGEPGRLALLAPAPGEQHTFGLSVVEDALRRGGWEVDCCRFGEEAEMFRLVARNHYRFVGLSLSGEALLPAFASAIGKLRARSRNPSIMVVAGGSLLQARPELASAAGVDLIADSAKSVLELAEGILVAQGSAPQVCVAAE